MKLSGTHTAIITPFKNEGLDEPAFERLVKRQVKAGVDGVVPVGSTGESPTVSVEEHLQLIRLAVKFADRKIKVIAGTGANSTDEAIHLTQAAKDLGADASLQVCPYYNKPTQEGLFQHFRAVARSAKLPIILYNIPGRCGVEIGVETIVRLKKECSNIVGVKESSGNPDRVSRLHASLGKNFTLLSGDDSMTLPFMAVGGHGVISVASNVIPKEMAQMVQAFANGDPATAQKRHAKYFSLFRGLFLETNPIPVKGALAMMGFVEESYRLPLVPLGNENKEALRATLKQCGLLKKGTNL